MSGAVHTAGPWEAVIVEMITDGKPFGHVYGADGEAIVYVTLREPEVAANTNLIAAAPELLEALEELFDDPGKIHSIGWTDKAAAAIAKARGAA